MNLTPWDVQSKQIHTTDGVAPTLYAAEKTWGGHSPIIFETHESSDIQENSSPSRQSGGQGWEPTDRADTLNVYDNSEARTPIVIVEIYEDADGEEIL